MVKALRKRTLKTPSEEEFPFILHNNSAHLAKVVPAVIAGSSLQLRMPLGGIKDKNIVYLLPKNGRILL